MTVINPTVALTGPAGHRERLALARRWHVHTVLTSHQPGNINMSQHTNINESIVVMRRHNGPKPPTRFVNLDRMPADDDEAADFHRYLLECPEGLIANGWGEVSYWPTERIEEGDWTPAIWRSPALANAAARYANCQDLRAIGKAPIYQTGRTLSGSFEVAEFDVPGSFPILKSKGADAQTSIKSAPDERWIPKKRREDELRLNDVSYPEADKILQKAGHLLVTNGQRTNTARLTATADNEKYVGGGWMPVTGLSASEAKAAAVFINSTAGRLQLMRNASRTLEFPIYNPAGVGNIKIPNVVEDARIRTILADCWEHTKDMPVPQFRDGECEVRRIWDEAVAEAMGWDANELARQRALLHREPHVRGLGYNQYGDE